MQGFKDQASISPWGECGQSRGDLRPCYSITHGPSGVYFNLSEIYIIVRHI
jgi:hypothetical protein